MKIRGFTLSGAAETRSGIRLHHVTGCNVSDNLACNNAAGISLVNAGNNVITNNSASYNMQQQCKFKQQNGHLLKQRIVKEYCLPTQLIQR